ncbi:hypothetical protein [Streptomyces acidicola]|uniref:hypothetical protein n=1 Tax=Streptomyces acidicola TaxID=2596892 RepID=UPI0037FA2D14
MTPSEVRGIETAAGATGPDTGRYLGARPVAAMLCVAGAVGDLVAFEQMLVHGPVVALPFLAAAGALLVVARWLWTSGQAAATLSAVVVLGVLTGLYTVAVGTGLTTGQGNEPLRADPVRTVVLVAQLAALSLLLRTLSGPARSWAVNGLLVIGVALWTLRLTGLLG